ncbi:MAG: hypothetical protein LHV69_11245 [Elusimicrobia bacterium]|nr:hypothetical protein [Candidatus Obscuribacterium magneticum]
MALTSFKASWAIENSILVGDVNGLEIQVKFMGNEKGLTGEKLIYEKGKLLGYRVSVKNRSNQSFPQVEMQSSLHVETAECPDLMSGSRLPGASISPLHNAALAPGITFNFDHAYTIPDSICPLKAQLKIRLQYTQRGVIKAQTVISPLPIQIK